MINGYIVANDNAIFGTGTTEAEAWNDLEQWVDTTEPAAYDRAAFFCVEATPALLAQVNQEGGDIAWGYLREGSARIACTTDEEDAA